MSYVRVEETKGSELVSVITDCPCCGREWTRMAYRGDVVVGVALELCPGCVGERSDRCGRVNVSLTTRCCGGDR